MVDVVLVYVRLLRLSVLPPFPPSLVRYYSITRGRLASTGLMKELQRAQVQVPG